MSWGELEPIAPTPTLGSARARAHAHAGAHTRTRAYYIAHTIFNDIMYIRTHYVSIKRKGAC